MKSTVSRIILTLLLAGLFLALASNIQPVKSDWIWTETICIGADGSVYPDTAPISTVDNVTYTLTDNIVGDISEWSSAIVVDRDNIVVDGAGYTLQGTGSARDHSIVIGMNLTGRINVTIKNMEVRTFRYGIRLSYSSNYNNITGNNVTDNYIGIDIYESSNNTISRNNITDNYWYGINLGGFNNTISGNNITNNALPSNSWGGGIKLRGFNNTFIGNTIINNYGYGIYLESSSNNTLRNNSAANNKYNFGVYGSSPSHYIQDIDDSNTVNGKPMYYLVNRRDVAVPLDAGYVALVNCANMTVQNLNLTNNARGILMVYTINSTITKNNITNNIDSILGVQSHSNIISGNNIGNNSWYCYYPSANGIDLNSSNNNIISGNNIVNNWNGIDLKWSNNNTISGNNIVNNQDGVLIYRSSINTVSGNNITNNRYGTSAMLSYFNIISGNNIADNQDGIHLESSSNNSISENNVANNDFGIYLGMSSSNSIYHNSFINNIDQLYDFSWDYGFPPSINEWDNGYPSGGNYWSDYEGRYPDAKEIDSSGIWDTPYVLDENNQDNYPLMRPWRVVEPSLFDLNNDGVVDIKDIAIAALAFGSYPDHPRWNPKADLNQDDRIDIKDLSIIARNFGKTYS